MSAKSATADKNCASSQVYSFIRTSFPPSLQFHSCIRSFVKMALPLSASARTAWHRTRNSGRNTVFYLRSSPIRKKSHCKTKRRMYSLTESFVRSRYRRQAISCSVFRRISPVTFTAWHTIGCGRPRISAWRTAASDAGFARESVPFTP